MFFVALTAGVNFLKADADISNLYSDEKVSSDYQSKLTVGVGGGYRTNISEQALVEISGHFNIVEDDFSTITMRAAILILLDNL